MKNYKEFKEILIKDIKKYLPKEYEDWDVAVSFTPKLNGFLETLNISPREESYAIPNIYINQFFDDYRKCGDIESTLQAAATFFIEGIEMGKNIYKQVECSMSNENIVFTLVNTKANEELLKECPHREILDLSIVYRWVMDLPDGSFNCAFVTEDAMRKHGLNEKEMYALATKNTERLFPPLIEEIDEGFNILTNKRYINGATSMIFKGQLSKLAIKMKSNLFILPSSIHEVIAIPDDSRNPVELMEMVKEANREVVEPKDVLSDSVYYYNLENDSLSVVMDFPREYS